jgi:hypothetical protein
MSAGPFWAGDIPATDLVVVPSRGRDDIDLEPYSEVDVHLYDPDGAEVPSSGFLATIDQEQQLVVIEWPADSVLTTAGLYTLVLVLLTEDGHRDRADSIIVAVQADDGWHTLESARAQWRDAPDDDAILWTLLESARVQCVEFAPALDGRRPPANYRQAELMQARAIWQSTQANASEQIGVDGYAVSVYPLDHTIRLLLRPKRAVPVVG